MINLTLDENLVIIEANTELYELLQNGTTQDLSNFLNEDDINKLKKSLNIKNSIVYVTFNVANKIDAVIKTVDITKLNDGRKIFQTQFDSINNIINCINDLQNKNKMYKQMVELLETEFFEYEKSKNRIKLFYNEMDVTYLGDLDELSTTLIDEKYVVLSSLLKQKNDSINYEEKNIEIKAKYYDGKTILGAIIEKSTNDNNERHDFLTGLYNKKTFIDFALKNINNESTLMIIDIDNFKHINDDYGHRAGDDMLKLIANIIRTSVGTYGIAGRFGGDEIVVFLTSNDELLVRSICESARINVQSKTKEIGMPVTISIGLARTPIDADKYEDIFELADKALYIAKNKGKNRYIIYREAMHKNIANKRTIIIDDLFINIFKKCNELKNASDRTDACLNEIKRVFNLSQINVYLKNKLVKAYGNDYYPEGVLSDSYLSFFDEKGILIVNNAQPIKSLNPTAYSLFVNQGVWSFVQVLIKKNDEVIGYVSFEDKIEQRSFTKPEVNALYTVANIMGVDEW